MMNENNFSYEQLNSTIKTLSYIENNTLNATNDEMAQSYLSDFLELFETNQLINSVYKKLTEKAENKTSAEWHKYIDDQYPELPIIKGSHNKLVLSFEIIKRLEKEGFFWLSQRYMIQTPHKNINVIRKFILKDYLSTLCFAIQNKLETMRKNTENQLKPSTVIYKNSNHYEANNNSGSFSIVHLEMSSDQKEEIINTLKQALSKVDKIENEDQRELASEYLEQTLDEVESGNIKPEKIEKRKKFFEKHKVDWIALAGLALAGFQIIQAFVE